MPDWNDVSLPTAGAGAVSLDGEETLENKTLLSPILDLPKIRDTSDDYFYNFAVSELAADRTITLPLLTGNATFAFIDFAQTWTAVQTFGATPTGAGITALFASPPALGGTAPAGASVTTLGASGLVTLGTHLLLSAGAIYCPQNADFRAISGNTGGAAFRIQSGTPASPTNNIVIDGATGNTTISRGNLILATAGKGVDFSANGAGDRVLDDFINKGTYTATLTCGTSGTITLNATNNKLGYTVKGDEVTVQGKITVDSVSSPLGDLTLNLPFTAANMAGESGNSAGIVLYSGVVAIGSPAALLVNISESATAANIFEMTTTGALADVSNHMQAGAALRFSFTYIRA